MHSNRTQSLVYRSVIAMLYFSLWTVPATAATYEAEALGGTSTTVGDAEATGSTAEELSPGDSLFISSGVAAGGYTLTVRIRGEGSAGDPVRARLTVDGQRVAEIAADNPYDSVTQSSLYSRYNNLYQDGATAWQLLSVPVYIAGSSTSISIEPADPNGPATQGKLYVDWIEWSPATVGYTARGNQVIDPSGNIFVLRGVKDSSHAPSTSNGITSWTEADLRNFHPRSHIDEYIQWMENWGMSAVVVEITENFWLGGCPSNVSATLYRDYVDAYVTKLTDKGMYVIVQLAIRGDYANDPCQFDWTGQMGFPVTRDTTWPSIANHFKNNPMVGFELNNEPPGWQISVSWETFRNGNDTWVGQQELYDAIRATGAHNLIFVPGMGMGYSNMQGFVDNWIDGCNLGYSVHHYNESGGMQPTATTRWALGYGWPMVVTEFGAAADGTPGDPLTRAALINFAETQGMAGWPGAFAWPNWWDAAYGLQTDPTTFTPSSQGQPVRDGLWAAKGWSNWGGQPPDTIKPAAITDLSATTSGSDIELQWTAPGDDGTSGTASFYEIRYSRVPITNNNFGCRAARTLTDTILHVPAPLAAGIVQAATAVDLNTTQRRYIAMKTGDNHATSISLSPLSNVVVLNPAAPLRAVTYEAQELCGPMVMWVSDATASGGFSVRADGRLEQVAAVDPGTCTITVRVKGNNAAGIVRYNGTQVQQVTAVPGIWREIEVAGVNVTDALHQISIEPAPLVAGLGHMLWVDWIRIAR